MNKYKEYMKEEIVEEIIDKYVKLDNSIKGAQIVNSLDQKVATLKYLRNLVKNITAESDDEIQMRIEEGIKRYNSKEETKDE